MNKKNNLIFAIIFFVVIFAINNLNLKVTAAAPDQPHLQNPGESLKQVLDPLTGAPKRITDEINNLPNQVSRFSWEWIKNKLNQIWQAIENWFYNTTGYTLTGTFAAIIKFLGGLFELVIKLFRQLYSWIANLI